MACGTGKTRVILEQLFSTTEASVVFFPTRILLWQFLNEGIFAFREVSDTWIVPILTERREMLRLWK